MRRPHYNTYIFLRYLGVLLGSFLASFSFFSYSASAAVLSISPSTGSFVVGSTFTASVFLNTEGQTVNTVGVKLLYPPDRLQLVSPTTGNSIITLWTVNPVYNNKQGEVTLQGGIPNGLKVENGLISNLVFRVTSVGTAYLKFGDSSSVLLNDGQGTEALHQLNAAVFSLVLPPPAGPIVASQTHPDQSRWYSQRNVSLSWTTSDPVDAYSYILSDQPIDFPDDIPENSQNSLEYKNLSDGIHYFHIKALHGAAWGGTTHFAIKIDATPPAVFPIEIVPSAHTTRQQPVIQYTTTDALSGIDHYELRILPLHLDSPAAQAKIQDQSPLFIESTSPYIPAQLDLGTYDVTIRAYDVASNYREITKRLEIVTPLLQFANSDGITVNGGAVVPWTWIFILLVFLILVLLYTIWHVHRWHKQLDARRSKKELSEPVQDQLAELKRYRSKYGLLIIFGLCVLMNIHFVKPVRAATISTTPPVVTTLSRSITNNEIFYVGGRSDNPKSSVILYVQNLDSGETVSQTVPTDQNGDWFYRHNTFLSSGDYRLWLQSKQGIVLSPPSPEQTMQVRTDAIQIGVSRISIEALFLLITILALMVVLSLVVYVCVHGYRARVKHAAIKKEIASAEESVKRGFAVLRRDIQNQIETIRKTKMSKELSAEEAAKEDQLFKDLQSIETIIGQEIWEIEKTEDLSKA